MSNAINTTGYDYAIPRCEALAHDAIAAAAAQRAQAVSASLRGLSRTAQAHLNEALRLDGMAQAFDTATAIIAGSAHKA